MNKLKIKQNEEEKQETLLNVIRRNQCDIQKETSWILVNPKSIEFS